jgi:hypothetical protein
MLAAEPAHRTTVMSAIGPTTSERSRAAARAALQSYDILESAPEAIFDAMTGLAANMCDVPIALATLVDENRQWSKSNCGLSGTHETQRSVSFCAHAILGNEIFEVPDAAADPRFAESPLVTGEPHIRLCRADTAAVFKGPGTRPLGRPPAVPLGNRRRIAARRRAPVNRPLARPGRPVLRQRTRGLLDIVATMVGLEAIGGARRGLALVDLDIARANKTRPAVCHSG